MVVTELVSIEDGRSLLLTETKTETETVTGLVQLDNICVDFIRSLATLVSNRFGTTVNLTEMATDVFQVIANVSVNFACSSDLISFGKEIRLV